MKNEQRMEPPAWRSQVFIYLGLTSLIWLVFGQTLGHPFVAYDDQNYVYENPSVTAGLSAAWKITTTFLRLAVSLRRT